MGRLVSQVWQYDPSQYAPPRYRRACSYEAFVPDRLAGTDFAVDVRLAGLIADAERAVQQLNEEAHPALVPLARLLLRTESIASSRVEGMQLSVRELARAEARAETGGKAGITAFEILANIGAMEHAIHEAAHVQRFSVDEILAIHARLMAGSANSHIAGRIRSAQNWIGGNDHNPCGADFVPRRRSSSLTC
ncbi:MAG: Fic/DOC family N-terminal domain-containing protein [Planctomycetaceae bacterium]